MAIRTDVAPWRDPARALEPASRDQFRTELTACISLCMPAGFDQATRKEWLTAAWGTLQGIPADLLARGCAAAREQCDHPSKVVPAIMREVKQTWDARKRAANPSPDAEREPRPWEDIGNVARRIAKPAEIAAIKEEMGLDTTPYPESPKPRGPLREPTVADYIALGVSSDEAEKAVAEREALKQQQAVAPAAGATAPRAPVRDRLAEYKRDTAHILVAKLLAHRVAGRSRRISSAASQTGKMKELIAKHGSPPLAWLIGATRIELEVLRLDAAA